MTFINMSNFHFFFLNHWKVKALIYCNNNSAKIWHVDLTSKLGWAYAEAATEGVLRNFAKFTGEYLCQSLFFNKATSLRHRCFPVNFSKFLRTPFLQNTSWQLLLHMHRGPIQFSKPRWTYLFLVRWVYKT